MSEIKICTFGGFDILFGNTTLSDIHIRREKGWIALKFLIAHYKRAVSEEELINILCADNEYSNPLNSLRNIIYRLRKTLSKYNDNIQYISFSNGMYSWNPTVECTIDTADFEKLLAEARDIYKSIPDRIEFYKTTINLYRGEFLLGEGGELWLMNFKNYYRRLYLSAISELTEIYEQQTAFEEVALLHSEAIKTEPFEESLYIKQISTLINIGDYTLAKQQYQNIERILKKEFDAVPSPKLQSLSLELGKAIDNQNVDLNQIKMNLDKDSINRSAIFCGPETFKRIYSYDKYLDERIQFPVILGLVSVEFQNDFSENDEKLRTVMRTLRQIMVRTLRQCDIICQYSVNQFVLMLTAASEENKMTPFHRIQRLFKNEFDENDVQIHIQATAIEENNF